MKKTFLLFVSLLLVFSLSGCSAKEDPQNAPVSKHIVELTEDEWFEFSDDVAAAFSKYAWENDRSMLDEMGLTLEHGHIETDDAFYYYDYTANGNGLLFCDTYDSHGMSQFSAEIAVTHDYGKTWTDVGSYQTTVGDFDPVIMDNGNICIALTSDISCSSSFLFSEDGGKSFCEVYVSNLFSELPDELFASSCVEILCADSSSNRIIVCWKYNDKCHLIAEFDATLSNGRILYRNDNLSEYGMEGEG